ncbi:MAG: hypothetical protein FWH27_11855 [Planctomycetaceae bacterium]|nr:hypothetical protein [Planctomycetaceae bacterium]
MSDHSISFIPVQPRFQGDRYAKAEEIVKWLVDQKAIEPTLSDCVFGDGGYRLLPGLAQFLEHGDRYFCPDLLMLGLEIITKKAVFHTGGNGLETVTCPVCQACENDPCDMQKDSPFLDLVGMWFDSESELVTCPYCQKEISITDFVFEPAWGFSDLGFSFWNCHDQFRDDFVKEFERRLGCLIRLVYTHL